METVYDLYKKEYYDLAGFNIEQATHLFLKYSIWKILGDFEKTCSINELLYHYGKIFNKDKKVKQLKEKFKTIIDDLEIAYIESRYLPVQFFKEQLDQMFLFVEKIKELLEIND